MASTSWEHQQDVREALRTIVGDPQLGVPALSSAQTMSNLLKDLLPDAPRETSVLVAAAEAGLAQTLRDHVEQGMDVATASALTASAFAARTPFTPEACTWAVGELAVALGLAAGTPPSGAPAPSGPGAQAAPGMGTAAGSGMPSGSGAPAGAPPGAAGGLPGAAAPVQAQSPRHSQPPRDDRATRQDQPPVAGSGQGQVPGWSNTSRGRHAAGRDGDAGRDRDPGRDRDAGWERGAATRGGDAAGRQRDATGRGVGASARDGQTLSGSGQALSGSGRQAAGLGGYAVGRDGGTGGRDGQTAAPQGGQAAPQEGQPPPWAQAAPQDGQAPPWGQAAPQGGQASPWGQAAAQGGQASPWGQAAAQGGQAAPWAQVPPTAMPGQGAQSPPWGQAGPTNAPGQGWAVPEAASPGQQWSPLPSERWNPLPQPQPSGRATPTSGPGARGAGAPAAGAPGVGVPGVGAAGIGGATLVAGGETPGQVVGPPGARPPARRKPSKIWGIGTAVIIAVALVTGLVTIVRHAMEGPPLEALSKIIKPDVRKCRDESTLQMAGILHSLGCTTHNSRIDLSAYQFDNYAHYRAGLARLNSIAGWDRSAVARGCPPPSGSSMGQIPWRTSFNPRYKASRPDQILECYTDIHQGDSFLYLWTLPSERVILIAGDRGPQASYSDLDHWWVDVTYG